MIDGRTLATIGLMATATYLTRVGGYLLLGRRAVSRRMMTVLEAAPGCVLIAVIAPAFVSGRPADLITLAMTGVAATRLPLLPTVMIGVGSAAMLRHVLS